MIDYVKILVKSANIEQLYSNPKLTFYREISTHTGETKTKEVASYHCCKILLYDNGTVVFKGSIHKFWNSINGYYAPNYKEGFYKGFNGNPFTLKDAIKVIEHLSVLFGCKPQQMIIRNIEFGINVELEFNPNKFLNGLLFHKGVPFESQFRRNYFEVEHQQYKIKIYNKSIQYQMSNNVLRFEIKYLKMLELNKIGVFTLQDICKESYVNIQNILFNRIDEVVYYDKTIQLKRLTKKQKELVKDYSNLNFWFDELKPNHRDRHKKRLIDIIEAHSKNLQEQIKIEMLKKCVIINQE